MKYANAETLKKELSQAPVWTALSVKEMIDRLSIEIVRCAECKYEPICSHRVQHTTYEPTSVTIGYKSVEWCSYGERKEP